MPSNERGLQLPEFPSAVLPTEDEAQRATGVCTVSAHVGLHEHRSTHRLPVPNAALSMGTSLDGMTSQLITGALVQLVSILSASMAMSLVPFGLLLPPAAPSGA